MNKPKVYQVWSNGRPLWEVSFGLQFCVETFDHWEMAMLRAKFPPVKV